MSGTTRTACIPSGMNRGETSLTGWTSECLLVLVVHHLDSKCYMVLEPVGDWLWFVFLWLENEKNHVFHCSGRGCRRPVWYFTCNSSKLIRRITTHWVEILWHNAESWHIVAQVWSGSSEYYLWFDFTIPVMPKCTKPRFSMSGMVRGGCPAW